MEAGAYGKIKNNNWKTRMEVFLSQKIPCWLVSRQLISRSLCLHMKNLDRVIGAKRDLSGQEREDMSFFC